MTLELEGIGKTVGRELHLDDVSMECAVGGLTTLLGLTGAGKTTLMRVMAGLDHPTSGRVLMHGRDVTGVPVRRRNVAMVYEQFVNYPSMTVYDNIASPLKLARMAKRDIDGAVRREAERLHIDGLLERLPGELSGGQQQRTAMARALVREADLLLLDEPLINLDYKLREELRGELREIFQSRRTVIVYATTDPLEALTLGGRTAVLHEGRLVQHGPTAEVYHRPGTLAVSQVFSDPPMNLVEGRLAGGELRLGRGDIRLEAPPHLRPLAEGEYRIGIRPQHVALQQRDERDLAVPGEVEIAEVSGSETYVHLSHHDAAWVVQAEGVHGFALGERITVYLDPRHLFAFGDDGRLAAAPAPAGTREAA